MQKITSRSWETQIQSLGETVEPVGESKLNVQQKDCCCHEEGLLSWR